MDTWKKPFMQKYTVEQRLVETHKVAWKWCGTKLSVAITTVEKLGLCSNFSDLWSLIPFNDIFTELQLVIPTLSACGNNSGGQAKIRRSLTCDSVIIGIWTVRV